MNEGIDYVPILLVGISLILVLQGFWEYSRCKHVFVGIIMGLTGTFGVTLTLWAVLTH